MMTAIVDLTDDQLDRLKRGDEQTLAELFSQHRQRLGRMVQFRLDQRLYGRVDPEDILQEAYLDAVKRTRHFVSGSFQSFFVWLRLIVNQTLINVHHRHLGAQMRDVRREVSIHGRPYAHTTSTSMAVHLLGNLTSPSQAFVRAETRQQFEQALDAMDPIDREVLALRHLEELSNSEVAEVLSIQQKAASIRYVRALERLREIMTQVPGLLDEDGRV
jgi:RNA polymerase sigma-70 factor (ECF subfamily)